MEASAGLVAGSHNRNELVVIRRDGVGGESNPRPLKQLSGQICQICGDDVGLSADGRELFVACNECAFPVCRTCYDYERKEGNQVCPQCKTRFKRLKGCPRVAGDEEEDDTDDLENEFAFAAAAAAAARNRQQQQHDGHYIAESMLQGHMSYGRGGGGADSDVLLHVTMPPQGQGHVPLLTNGGHTVDDIPPEQHALVPSYIGSGGGGGGKRIHPFPFADPNQPVHPRSMDPSKDLAAYGYGSVAWKERMETWKQKQDKLQMTRNDNGGKDWDNDGDSPDLPL